jgi:hypothetical protein
MSGRALAAVLALWAAGGAARAECVGRAVIVPFEYVAADAKVAHEAEQRVREAAARQMGACVEGREATVKRLQRLGPFLSACPDDACRANRAAALEAGTVVEGVALGMGGRPSLALSVWGRDGKAVHASVPLGGAEPELDALFDQWARRERGGGPWPFVSLGAAAGAVAVGAFFGARVRHEQQAVSDGTACAGTSGQELSGCLGARLAQGRRDAVTANVLWGAGAALAAGGTVWLVWEWR